MVLDDLILYLSRMIRQAYECCFLSAVSNHRMAPDCSCPSQLIAQPSHVRCPFLISLYLAACPIILCVLLFCAASSCPACSAPQGGAPQAQGQAQQGASHAQSQGAEAAQGGLSITDRCGLRQGCLHHRCGLIITVGLRQGSLHHIQAWAETGVSPSQVWSLHHRCGLRQGSLQHIQVRAAQPADSLKQH